VVRASKIRPGFKKPLRPIFCKAPPLNRRSFFLNETSDPQGLFLIKRALLTPAALLMKRALPTPAALLMKRALRTPVRYLTLNMPRVTVTRRLRFNAAHRVHNPALSDAENAKLFGKCNNPNWHGHNYTLDVSVEGEIDAKTGYVCDLSTLKTIVEKEIVDVPFMRDVIPTSENIVTAFWKILAPKVKPGTLTRLVLWETENNYVEYTGK
jgi:6-pyruvoyltetrahydropterin/6-carboxytetrahydropterin synthase